MAYDQVRITDKLSPGHNVTITPASDVHYEYPIGLVYDVNGTLQQKDMSRFGPIRLSLVIHTALVSNADWCQLLEWRDIRAHLNIEDLAYTAPGVPATDAFIYQFQGMLVNVTPSILSPRKHSVTEATLEFMIHDHDVIVVP